ncbi:hypothetical protein GQ54DRAFT_297648 [Martensiomyces pterosporus]|nr:hypothetical protein GQ54DRAFT_297648 [Martensiomyces pterosporus]
MKESKYDRILWYVQMQQQNVAAMADMAHQRDIDNSLLMSGQLPYEYDPAAVAAGPDYMEASRRSMEQMTAAQQQQQQLMHAGAHAPHVASNAAPMPTSSGAMGQMLAPAHPGSGGFAPAGLVFQPNNPLLPPPLPIKDTATNRTNTSGTVQKDGEATHNEEDDNTPLAAINIGSSPRQRPATGTSTAPDGGFQPNSLNIAVGSSLEKYMNASLDDPLPNPVSPTNAARLSMLSFQTNMADNMNSENQALSRSHSLSNQNSLSIQDSAYRMTPVPRSPTTQDTSAAQYMPISTGSARHPSFPSVPTNKRPSLEAITPRTAQAPAGGAQTQQSDSADYDGDEEPLAAIIAAGSAEDGNVPAKESGAADAAENIAEEGEEEDNEPLHKQWRASKIVCQDGAANLGGPVASAEQAGGELTEKIDSALATSRVDEEADAPLQTANKAANGTQDRAEQPRSSEAQPSGEASEGVHSASESDAESSVPLRVVNQVSNDDSDASADENDVSEEQMAPQPGSQPRQEQGDSTAAAPAESELRVNDSVDDDDQPLMNLTRHLSESRGAHLTVGTAAATAATEPALRDGDDDDQPLSSLLFSPHAGGDDIGSLPLPLPRHIKDPHEMLDMDGVIDETAVPMRSSLGERPTSPPIDSSVVRKHSSLSRSYRPLAGRELSQAAGIAAGFDSGDNRPASEVSSAARQSVVLNKQRSSLSGYSLPAATAVAAMAVSHTGSLPRSLRMSPDVQTFMPASSQRSPHSPQQHPLGFAKGEAIAEDEDEEAASSHSDSDGEVFGYAHGKEVAAVDDAVHTATGALAVGDGGQREVQYTEDILDTAQLHSGGHPWAKNRVYSASASSLTGIRRTMRGSTLGQKLTDELHKLREDLARSRNEGEKAERRSWQVGTSFSPRRPWMRHENTKSETALPQKLADAGSINGQDSHLRTIEDGDEEVRAGVANLPPGWERSANPRPMTTYQPRSSRWFGKSSGGKLFHGWNHGQQQQQQSNDDAAVISASPQSNGASSLSTRLNHQFGKLKKTFKH